jgi:3-phenylpropionate/trans-cinnamate dioxygenase ferredoxin component
MDVEVCPVEELPPGTMKLVPAGSITVGVFNVDGRLCAIEDRCSHDDGPLCEGDWEPDEGVVICPRHGSRFDICSGRPLTLPAYVPVETFPVYLEDGMIKVKV